jgi:hypothetical protein
MKELIEAKFQEMGARARVTTLQTSRQLGRRWNGQRNQVETALPIRIDIARDADGEYFDVLCRRDARVHVLDVRPSDRHLLLSAIVRPWSKNEMDESKFLCGHDERAWFVASIPEKADARNVQDAKDALKPDEVWESIRMYGVPMSKRDQRRTVAFVRQGEWFFIPRPELEVEELKVLHNEPIARGGGKAHMCQFLYRTGGEQVWVSEGYENGLLPHEYMSLPRDERNRWRWRQMFRDARAYVKGAIRHPDHKTVWLSFWHEVVMNTETQARAMQHVAFLD